MKPRLLDLFCGAGGAAMGYSRAGFEVVGVDLEPQPRYPFAFIRADVLEFLSKPWGQTFNAIHASPPCQRYMTGGTHRKDHPDLIAPVRRLLKMIGLVATVIENVPGAPLRPDLMLCGSMFGLQVRRHRVFEFSEPTTVTTPDCDHRGRVTGVYGNPHGKRGAWPGMLPSTPEVWGKAMGIDWMDARELSQAIPPAYTEFIGEQLMRVLEVRHEVSTL